MEAKQVKKKLVQIYESSVNGMPAVLLLGPPGCGKTTSAKEAAMEIAKRMGAEFVEFDIYAYERAVNLAKHGKKVFVYVELPATAIEAIDLTGKPASWGRMMTYEPPIWAMLLKKFPGVLLIDEITAIQLDDVIAASHRLIQEKLSGFTKLGEKTLIVATGNTGEHSAIARELPAPLINRMIVYKVDAPKLESWKSWMDAKYGDAWDIRVYIFLKTHPDLFLERSPPSTFEQFATPRAWTRLALLLKQGIDDRETICGVVGSNAGNKFYAWMKKDIGTVEDYLEGRRRIEELDREGQYILCSMVAQYIGKSYTNFQKAVRLIRELKEITNEYLVLIAVLTTKAAKKWMAKYSDEWRSILLQAAELKLSL